MFNEEKSESHIVTTHGATKKRDEDTGQGVPAPKVPENNLQENKARDDKEAVNFVGRSLSDSPSEIKDKRDETVDNEVNDEQILHVEDGVSEGKPANVGENASSLEEHPTEEDGSSHVKVSARSQSSSQGIQTSPLKENEDLSDDTEDTRVSWSEAELLDTGEQRSQKDKREDVFELEGSLKLETTFGSTMDAIVVDDEMSSKVTMLDELPVFDFELQKDELVESPEKVDPEEIALLTYSDSKYQQQPELPEEDHNQDDDVDEDHAVKSDETNYTAVAEDVNLAMTSVSPGKEQLVDEVMEESVSIRVINKPFSAEDLNDKEPHDTNQAKEHVASPRATNEKVEGLEMINKELKDLEESDSAKNNQGDGSLSSDDSNSKLTEDDISDQLQEEKKEEDIEILEDFNAVDEPEELLEDENAAEAGMAQNIHSNTTDDEEEISDGKDLDDEDQVLELEAVLHDLEDELRLSKLSRINEEDIEKTLDRILEGSETRILDMVENIETTGGEFNLMVITPQVRLEGKTFMLISASTGIEPVLLASLCIKNKQLFSHEG
eukprot:g37639.t1